MLWIISLYYELDKMCCFYVAFPPVWSCVGYWPSLPWSAVPVLVGRRIPPSQREQRWDSGRRAAHYHQNTTDHPTTLKKASMLARGFKHLNFQTFWAYIRLLLSCSFVLQSVIFLKICHYYPLCCQRLSALSQGQWGEVLNTFVHLRLRQRRQQLPQSILCWQTLWSW